MANATPPKLLLSEAEAAESIGLTRRFLQARRHRGGGPKYVKVSSRCVRYAVADLEEWARERTVTSTADHARD